MVWKSLAMHGHMLQVNNLQTDLFSSWNQLAFSLDRLVLSNEHLRLAAPTLLLSGCSLNIGCRQDITFLTLCLCRDIKFPLLYCISINHSWDKPDSYIASYVASCSDTSLPEVGFSYIYRFPPQYKNHKMHLTLQAPGSCYKYMTDSQNLCLLPG